MNRKRKRKLLEALRARAASVGSKAKTIKGMGAAVLASTRPLAGLSRIETRQRYTTAPRPDWRFYDASKTREWYTLVLRSDRIARKAAESSRYRLPKRAEPASIKHLASIRQAQERAELERCANSVERKLRDMFGLDALAADIAREWPLRRSESRWAGGEHEVEIYIRATPGCSAETKRVWSDNGKWSGTNSTAYLHVTLHALAHFPTLRTADGSIVLDAQKVGQREYRLTWVGQSVGVDIKPITGWLIRGYHSTRKTIDAARAEAREARQRALSATLRKRASAAKLRSAYVQVEDSLAAGNCKTETDAFAARAWREIGAVGPCAVRADLVVGLRDDAYTRRAVNLAVARQ